MKILLISEYTYLCTGYAAYYRQIAEALHNAGHQVAELASYGNPNIREHTEYARRCPWRVYLNVPHSNDKESQRIYSQRESSSGDAKFGSWMFEQICLQEKPDIVISVRDYWYDRFITESPFHDCFTSILSPTVDTLPQKADWLDAFHEADYVTTYNEWSESWLKQQYHCRNLMPFISPGFKQHSLISKENARKALGLPLDIKLVGTVMRNQNRKRFPELCAAVAQVDDLFLYCHTHYPDKGWDLPTLFARYGIQNRVYMTYICENCHDVSHRLFNHRSFKCSKCGGNVITASVLKGLDEKGLRHLYSSFDLYLQPHNSEGFGIPTIEAAMCGVKVVSTDYSAQQDVIPKIDAIGVKPIAYDTEMKSLCNRAVIDIDGFVEILKDPTTYQYDRISIANKAAENYTEETCKEKWVKLVNLVEQNRVKNWEKPIDVRNIPEFQELAYLSNSEYIMWCITKVAQEPNFIGSYTHLYFIDALNAGMVIPLSQNNELGDKPMQITRKEVYNKFKSYRERYNQWELRRKSFS